MSLICYARKYDVELIIRLILNIFTTTRFCYWLYLNV